MSTTSAMVAVDFQLTNEFNAVRQQLLARDLNGHWDKPLAYWARTTDRHLPMALVDKTLRYVVETPFKQLSRTPGVGAKKLGSLIMLMSRAAEGSPGVNGVSRFSGRATAAQSDDASAVSEALWSEWGSRLRGRGLGQERLGRFASSLREIPRSMWFKRLDDYLLLSLREIRALRGHGEKRVTALIEIVGALHQITEQLASQPHMAVRVGPRLEAQLEAWFAHLWLAASESTADDRPAGTRQLPDDAAVCGNLLEPLIEQARVDLGEHAAVVLRHRLFNPQSSVQQAAYHAGLTRGRVYEIVADMALVLDIRWPQGRRRMLELRTELAEAVSAGATHYRSSLSRVETTIAVIARASNGGT